MRYFKVTQYVHIESNITLQTPSSSQQTNFVHVLHSLVQDLKSVIVLHSSKGWGALPPCPPPVYALLDHLLFKQFRKFVVPSPVGVYRKLLQLVQPIPHSSSQQSQIHTDIHLYSQFKDIILQQQPLPQSQFSQSITPSFSQGFTNPQFDHLTMFN